MSLTKYLNTGNRLKVFCQFENRFPQLAALYRKELHEARVETTLSYARDLILARQFISARARLRESWTSRPSWEGVVLWLKLTILTLIGYDRSKR